MSDIEISDTALCSYVEALLWSECLNSKIEIEGETYDEGTPLDQIPGLDVSDIETLNPKLWAEALENLQGFASDCVRDLGINPFQWFDESRVSHDFALSQNGHGAGFFDDPYTVEIKGPSGYSETRNLSDCLQRIARNAGTFGLIAWVDEGSTLKIESHG